MRNAIPQTFFSTTNINKLKPIYQQTLLIYFFPILIQFHSLKKHWIKLFPSTAQVQQRALLRGCIEKAPPSADPAAPSLPVEYPRLPGKPIAVRTVMPSPAATAAQIPLRLALVNASCHAIPCAIQPAAVAADASHGASMPPSVVTDFRRSPLPAKTLHRSDPLQRDRAICCACAAPPLPSHARAMSRLPPAIRSIKAPLRAT